MDQGIPYSYSSQPTAQDPSVYYSTQYLPNDIASQALNMNPNTVESMSMGIDPAEFAQPMMHQHQMHTAELPPQIPPAVNATQPSPTSNFDAFPGIYSSSGFDLFGILARLADRPNKQIQLGPVDLSCAFLVVDARKFDFPILYASPNFEKLTGYSIPETIGRNCRFLQAPNGHVTLGSRRRYTDNSAVHQLKSRVVHGKEHQISLVNYKKDGTPFMNLVTVIPISIGDEITYFIGLQVDLVEQPNAILDRMKDGTYAVNYAQVTIPQQMSPSSMSGHSLFANMAASSLRPGDIYESIVGRPRDENSYIIWNQILVNHCDDFVHVLTIKGVFLFSSPSTSKLLGYSADDLVGNSISQYCHPSDYTPMLRELKDAADSSDPFSLVYRIRHKDGHYLWMESLGRLYVDKSKGRKFLILSGRIRPLYQLSMNAVVNNGGFVPGEFWSKLSLDGMFLYVTTGCQDSLDMDPQDFVGTSMYQFVRSDKTTPLTRALHQAREGIAVRISHHLRSGKGVYVNMVSTMYPGDVFNDGKPAFILCQSRPVANSSAIGSSGNNSSRSGSQSGDESIDSTNANSVPSPQDLGPPTKEDNMFDVLDPERSSTWQLELHQLRLANKKLKEELEQYEAKTKPKTKKHRMVNDVERICAHCLRKNSPEWRKGPDGPGTLCNSCGIKYAKSSSGGSSSPERNKSVSQESS